jgi:hypothetical protein
MKRKLAYLISIFFVFAIVVGAYFSYLKISVKQGKIKILSSPAANIVINNKSIGKTPYEDTIDTGDYIIKLIPDANEASESATWNGKISVYQNTLTFVNRELGSDDLSSSGVVFSVKKMDQKPTKKNTGEIEIKSEPDGAIVYLDNDEQGIAPLILSEVAEGEHELAVDSPGYFRRSQKIKVENGYRVIADYKLAVDPTYKKVDKEQAEEDRKKEEEALKKEKEKDATQSSELKPSISPTKSPSASKGSFTISINETSTGWLRVRSKPSTAGTEIGKANPGDTYEVLDEQSGWYQIDFNKQEGWVSSTYVTKVTSDEVSR